MACTPELGSAVPPVPYKPLLLDRRSTAVAQPAQRAAGTTLAWHVRLMHSPWRMLPHSFNKSV